MSASALAIQPTPTVTDSVTVDFTGHALKRMAEMGVLGREVEDALRCPDTMYPSPREPGTYVACRGRVAVVIAPHYRTDRTTRVESLVLVWVITVLWNGSNARIDGPKSMEIETMTGVPARPSNRSVYEQMLLWGWVLHKRKGDTWVMRFTNGDRVTVMPPNSNAAGTSREAVAEAIRITGVSTDDFWARKRPVEATPNKPGGVTTRAMTDAELEKAAEAMAAKREAEETRLKERAEREAREAAAKSADRFPVIRGQMFNEATDKDKGYRVLENKVGTAREWKDARHAVFAYLRTVDEPIRSRDVTASSGLPSKSVQNAITALRTVGLVLEVPMLDGEDHGFVLADDVRFASEPDWNLAAHPFKRSTYSGNVGGARPGAGRPRKAKVEPEAAPVPESVDQAEAQLAAVRAEVEQAEPAKVEHEATIGGVAKLRALIGGADNVRDITPPAPEPAKVEPAPKPPKVEQAPPRLASVPPVSVEDDLEALLDMWAPDGFKARHLPYVLAFQEAARALYAAVHDA